VRVAAVAHDPGQERGRVHARGVDGAVAGQGDAAEAGQVGVAAGEAQGDVGEGQVAQLDRAARVGAVVVDVEGRVGVHGDCVVVDDRLGAAAAVVEDAERAAVEDNGAVAGDGGGAVRRRGTQSQRPGVDGDGAGEGGRVVGAEDQGAGPVAAHRRGGQGQPAGGEGAALRRGLGGGDVDDRLDGGGGAAGGPELEVHL